MKKVQQIYPSVTINEIRAYVIHSGKNLSMLYTFKDKNDYLSKI